MSDKRLIVGLGNPGSEYEATRHNMGFLTVTRLAADMGVRLKKSTSVKGLWGEGRLENSDVVLLLPHSFMNNSGVVVKQAVMSKKIEPENVLVVCDDFSLVFGQMRMRQQGSDGGHNGLSSVIEHLGTKVFSRLRLGIGPVPAHKNTVDFVLEDFQLDEKKRMPEFLTAAVDCCRAWTSESLATVMSRYNQKLLV
ncbi:MAG: aminoacyl-tRNA hydrolase [Candidatus Omnitrophica bacterium]|nr:aminoacyl-tRNA hydrolase [Candidatus Omnitrophota bacterium]